MNEACPYTIPWD